MTDRDHTIDQDHTIETDRAVVERRRLAIDQAMDDIRSIETDLGVTRVGVEAIRDRLVELTADRTLFPAGTFPPPGIDEPSKSRLYRIAQDDDDRFALYANACRGRVATPAHNHSTWAVVVGFDGTELNRFYQRSDDGVTPIDAVSVEYGTGVAMLPDDLHSIHIDGPALSFHCYGLALERLDQRQYYSASTNEWKVFPAHVDISEARVGPIAS